MLFSMQMLSPATDQTKLVPLVQPASDTEGEKAGKASGAGSKIFTAADLDASSRSLATVAARKKELGVIAEARRILHKTSSGADSQT